MNFQYKALPWNVIVPTLTLYDPALTLTMPAAFAGASGLNAMAQDAVNVCRASRQTR